MGREATCKVSHRGRTFEARVSLETAEVVVRGERGRLSVPLAELITLEVRDGWLQMRTGVELLSLELGEDAEGWAERIRHPPSLMKKLGISNDTAVAVVGAVEPAVLAEAREAGARIVRTVGRAEVVLIAVGSRAELRRLEQARTKLADDAAIWVIWAKGRKELTETHVREAALAHGLVDVKVASVNAALSGLKLVVPRAARTTTRRKR